MRRPHGPLGWTTAFLLTCLMSACGGTGQTPPAREADGSEDRSKGSGVVELAWGPVEPVSAAWATRQATVMAPDGTATVIWFDAQGAISREAAPGKPWAAEETIPGAGIGGHVIAGVDGQGTVTAVWDQDDDARYSFWSAQHPTGGRWSPPVELGGDPLGDDGWQGWDLAVSPSGAAVFAWGPESGPVRAVYRDAGGEWSPPASLPGDPPWQPMPKVTIDPDGLASVAYLHDSGLLTLVQGSAAGWDEPVDLEAPVGLMPYDLDAAKAGEVVVVWQEADLGLLTARLVDGELNDQSSLTAAGEKYVDVQVAASSDGSAGFVLRPGDPEAAYTEQANGEPLPGADDDADREVRGLFQTADGSLGDVEVIGPTSRCEPMLVFAVAMDRNDRGDTILA